MTQFAWEKTKKKSTLKSMDYHLRMLKRYFMILAGGNLLAIEEMKTVIY